MEESKGVDKIERVLGIYSKLMSGAIVYKAEEDVKYNVNERSIQRDIDDIRNFIIQDNSENGNDSNIIFDYKIKGYRLEQVYCQKFTNSEILAICKILLDSRAFTKNEMDGFLAKLLDSCVPQANRDMVNKLIRNEQFHYIEPHHKTVFIDKMWEIGQAILNQQFIEIKYQGIQGSTVKTRKLKPMAIMFSEYYFYLTTFIEDKKVHENFRNINDTFPTIYRMDRIQEMKVLNERYTYKSFMVIERTKLPKIKDMLSWGVVSAGDVLIAKGYDEEVQLLANGHVTFNNEEMSMQDWLKRMTGWKSVETYKFAVHKATGKSLSEIRKEYMDENME